MDTNNNITVVTKTSKTTNAKVINEEELLYTAILEDNLELAEKLIITGVWSLRASNLALLKQYHDLYHGIKQNHTMFKM